MDPQQQDKVYARAAGGLADSLAANPFTSNPARNASMKRTGRSLAGLRGAQTALAAPGFGGGGPTGIAAYTADANNRARAIGNSVAKARSLGQLAASPQGWTDDYGITTRRGIATPGPAMGNQAAIDAAYASRPVKPMPTIGLGRDVDGNGAQPMHAQGVTLNEIFSPGDDPARRAAFEDAKERRASRRDDALKMRQQRAQYRLASGDHLGSPMFNQDGRLDMLDTLAAQNMGNPVLAGNALATGRTLDRLAEQAAFDNQAATRRLDQIDDQFDASVQQQFAEQQLRQREIAEREAAGEYNRGQVKHDRTLETLGRDATPTLSPDESFRAYTGFTSLTPEGQGRSIDWGGNEIRRNPKNATQIAAMVGATDEDLIDAYTKAHESPNFFMENDTDGAKQKAKLDRIGLMLDARGIPRPKLPRKLPAAQEFLGFHYQDPYYKGQTLDDLLNVVSN